MIDITIPLSLIEFVGELETRGTNGAGDLVYVNGNVGMLNIIDYPVDRNQFPEEIPDKVEAKIRLSL